MKFKTILLASVLFSFTGAFLTSCSDDDDEVATETSTSYASEIAATYTGDLYVALSETMPELSSDYLAASSTPLSVVEDEDGTVTFKLTNFAFSGMTLGDIVLPGVGVEYSNGTYTFVAGETQSFSFLSGMLNATANMDVANSYIKGSDIYLTLNVVWIQDSENTPIAVVFTGSK